MVDDALEAAVLAHTESYTQCPQRRPPDRRGARPAASPESLFILPVASRIAGQADSDWRTDLRVLNLSDEVASVWAEWYPSSSEGQTGPALTVELGVGGSSTAVVNDSVATLFGADGNGAMRLLAAEPLVAASRIFNDQRANPEVGGTFGQYAPASRPAELLSSGALLLGASRPAASGEGLRSNVGYFNPYPGRRRDDLQRVVGRRPAARRQRARARALRERGPERVPAGALGAAVGAHPRRPRGELRGGAAIAAYLSVVDNVTNGPVLVSPSPAPAVIVGSGGSQNNRPPSGVIVQPAGSVTISEGESVVFEGSASDPDGDAMTYLWDFGDNISSTELSPEPTPTPPPAPTP